MNDTQLLDWLQEHGEGFALLSDDFGRWAGVCDGMQNEPDDIDQPADIHTTHFVKAATWKPTVREAIHAAAADDA